MKKRRMNAPRTRAFRVTGLDCAEEIAALRREVGPVVGGEARLGFDLLRGRMTVDAEARRIPDAAILDAVRRAGLAAEPWRTEGEERGGSGDRLRRRRLLLTVLSGAATAAAFSFTRSSPATSARRSAAKVWAASSRCRFVARLLYAVGIAAGIVLVSCRRPGWRSAAAAGHEPADDRRRRRRRRPSASGSRRRRWPSCSRSRCCSSRGASAAPAARSRALMDLSPPTARCVSTPARARRCRPSRGAVGAHVRGPARRADSARRPRRRRRAPTSTRRRSPARACRSPRSRGDEVFAGTINGDGALEVRGHDGAAEDTTLARIIRMVEEAQARRAPSEQWVERFARVYTPAMMAPRSPSCRACRRWSLGASLGDVVLPRARPAGHRLPLRAGDLDAGEHRAGARRGRAARRADQGRRASWRRRPGCAAIAFDKTGTLTRRRSPRCGEIVPLNGHTTRRELLARAAALEAHSEHPLARGHLRARRGDAASRRRRADGLPRASRARAPTAAIDGRHFWLGSPPATSRSAARRPPDVHARAGSAGGRRADRRGRAATTTHVCGLIARRRRRAAEARRDAVAELQAARHRARRHADRRQRATAEAVGRASAASTRCAPSCCPRTRCAAIEELVGALRPRGDGRRRRQRRPGHGARDARHRHGRRRHRRRHRDGRHRADVRRPVASCPG